ncbi:alpha/beta fold hydrolase [Phaeovulum vinaykumarii]|uniref:Pimeloyl-ACP methyl ester carboxylesterase n=1 Tax=Phaeovulum vinaykumarii TaxID=407234 RepID=A0A1N7JMY2_9RHOB|nr:alpha/beta hydrolase [Phaeovulum vinaykumarii]SIS50670.1 Pimeloyl-ACP methyl ester carboxylesterase [Phaeovulum vinaykumarii]SOB90366.1 pimeloyl-ACP methyl ester carboxylesterase [Phaeovulum vinaykumarii]
MTALKMTTELRTRMGRAIAATRFGHGDRPALGVHCMLGRAAAFQPMAAHLADTITLQAFDLPGHGDSAPFPAPEDGAEPPEFQRLCTQIAASFIDRPVDLIGHSFGAGIALRLAVAAPEAVRSLTLIEPVTFAAIADQPEGRAEAAALATLEAQLAAGEDLEPAAQTFMATWGAGQPWSEMSPARRARMVARMPLVAQAGRANLHDPGRILREGGLEAIDAPVMMVLGAESPAVVHRTAEALAERMADVGRAVVPGAGHMLVLTHPRQVADLVALNLERS